MLRMPCSRPRLSIGMSLAISIWNATRCAPLKKPSNRKAARVTTSRAVPLSVQAAIASASTMTRMSDPTVTAYGRMRFRLSTCAPDRMGETVPPSCSNAVPRPTAAALPVSR